MLWLSVNAFAPLPRATLSVAARMLRVTAVAPAFVTKPPVVDESPTIEPRVMLKPLRSNTLPAPTVRAVLAVNTPAAPALSTPPDTTVLP